MFENIAVARKCNSDVKCCSSSAPPDENGCCEFDQPACRPQHFSILCHQLLLSSVANYFYTFTNDLLSRRVQIDKPALQVQSVNWTQILKEIKRKYLSSDFFWQPGFLQARVCSTQGARQGGWWQGARCWQGGRCAPRPPSTPTPPEPKKSSEHQLTT